VWLLIGDDVGRVLGTCVRVTDVQELRPSGCYNLEVEEWKDDEELRILKKA
jgi:hypothetical protein